MLSIDFRVSYDHAVLSQLSIPQLSPPHAVQTVRTRQHETVQNPHIVSTSDGLNLQSVDTLNPGLQALLCIVWGVSIPYVDRVCHSTSAPEVYEFSDGHWKSNLPSLCTVLHILCGFGW